MKRQMFLPMLGDCPYFCFAESAGWYSGEGRHRAVRSSGEMNKLFNLHLVISGKGYVEWNGKLFCLGEGDAFLYFPGQEQHYYSSEEEPWEIRWVHFYGKGLAAFMTELGFHRTPIWTLKRRGRLEQDLHRLLMELEEYRLLRPAVISEKTYRIITGFTVLAEPLGNKKNQGRAGLITSLLPELESCSHRTFILEEWADKAGLSVYYFCRLFKKITGMTPLEFVTLCRLQSAKQLLLERPELHVAEIARSSGYNSASYFNSKFLESEGMTPTDYRKLMALKGR
ncbi:MAG: transcriptional regulatory protein [Paenibacillaceae bacterium]|nr:transcriptional regulatory protein [Paenibacillaceae bacterium]